MLRWLTLLTLWIGAGARDCLGLETLELKDHAAVTGRILSEKPDQYVVDIGYTVLLVPKAEVLRVISADPGGDPGDGEPAGPGTVSREQAASDSSATLYLTAAEPPPELSVREQVSRIEEAVVQVRTPSGLGSGFFIREDGHLITNFHVVEGETRISIEVYHRRDGQLERRTYKDVRIVALNKFRDLALLKVEDEGAPKFTAVYLGDSDLLAVGERVFAIGSPLGLERTVTEGIVSTKTRELRGDLYLQTTAQINQGNSGGPLFNLRGEVVGVTNMKAAFGEGLGFAIPVEEVRSFLRRRDAFAFDNQNPSTGYRYLEPPRRLKLPVFDAAP